MTGDPALLTLAEAADALAARHLSSVELTQACLTRVKAWQPHVNAFINIDEERALAQAALRDKELADGYRRGRLQGIPLAHKDMFFRKGRVTTAGSEVLRAHVADTTSTLLERLDRAGAVDLGTLNMSEFAAGPTGHNIHFGHCRNPYNRDHMTGGSSSGSGAAVAARLAFGALGSDTGASVRVPAAANGIVGLKPTYGRVSRNGAFARSWSLDHIGPLARTARDCAILLGTVAGRDDRDATSSNHPVPDYEAALEGASLAGLRIGVLHDDMRATVDPEILSFLDESIRLLQSHGATAHVVALPDLGDLLRLAETIIKSEAAAIHRQWIDRRPEDYATQVRLRIEAGFFIPAVDYIDALRLRELLTREFLELTLKDVDLIHLPVLPFRLPTIAESDVEGANGDAVAAIVKRVTTFTRPFNFLGVPAISVPCGMDSGGLPVAFQLVGRPFAEALLLQVAHAYQAVTRFHRAVPQL